VTVNSIALRRRQIKCTVTVTAVEMNKAYFLVVTRSVFYFLQLRFTELGGGKLRD
jgi:hypothetical protein